MTQDPTAKSAPTLGSRFLCWIGLHNWLVIRRECPMILRSEIQDGISGRYSGRCESFRRLEDRVCARCERRDNQIARATEQIEREERAAAEIIRRATVNDPPLPERAYAMPPRSR